MAPQMSLLSRASAARHHLLRRPISTSPVLSQEPQLQDLSSSPADADVSAAATPLPPSPSTGSPFYQDASWRTPSPSSAADFASLLSYSLSPLGVTPAPMILQMSETLDVASLMNVFADWMTSQRWADLKQLFEFWIRSLDKNGKPNKPDVNLYNHYLRASLMNGACAGELLDLVLSSSLSL